MYRFIVSSGGGGGRGRGGRRGSLDHQNLVSFLLLQC